MSEHATSKVVFLTGATGAMGLAVTRSLVVAGHAVIGVTRSGPVARYLSDLGASPVTVSLFDISGLARAMQGADVVAHFATSIPSGLAATRRRAWLPNDRLRTEGTKSLIAAARVAGVRRFIFESIALAYSDRGETWIDETVPLDPPSPVMRSAMEAEQIVEAFGDDGGEGVCLRFGRLYGPGRASRELVKALRNRSMPVVGAGDNYMSSVHVTDVGKAVAAALHVAPGVYNVVDDQPMRQRDLLDLAAKAMGARRPRHLPLALGRLLLGHVARVLTVSQRVSNQRFRLATGWSPTYLSAADGWLDVAAAMTPDCPRVAA